MGFFENLIGLVILVLMLFRCVSFTSFFEPFAVIFEVFKAIIWKTSKFFVILIWFFFLSVVLVLKLRPLSTSDPEKSALSQFFEEMENMLFWGVFRSINAQAFDFHDLAFLPVLFGSIILNIILLNFLIAYFVRIFNEIESKKKIITAKERAIIMLRWEVIIHFFKYLRYRKSPKYSISKDYYDDIHKKWIQADLNDSDQSESEDAIFERKTLLIIEEKGHNKRQTEEDQGQSLGQISELTGQFMNLVNSFN